MEQIGDYLVRRLIGEGGMGKVYEAEERLSKRRVALKVLHQELARSDEGRRLFLNEMQILAHLEHPNIVRSLASIEADGELVMVLEYLDGRTLRARLNAEGRFAWTDAIRVVADIAAALSAAHGQEPPIIHRDLKPENIMVLDHEAATSGPKGRAGQADGGAVKVMDFGIAKVIEALNQTNTQSVGTLQYMSPEQIDAHTIDHRSDLYCLGLIFYELLAGRPPFHSASPRQLLNLQCTAEPPPLPDEVRAGLPRGVEQLLFQLLEKAPEDRPYLAEDVMERLEPFQVAAPAKGGSRAPVTPRASAGTTAPRAGATAAQRTPVSSDRRTPKPSSGDAPAVSAPRSAEASSAASAASPKAETPRADTIALLDRVDKPREVTTRVAVGIIVALSALAGIAAYVLRASAVPAETPAIGPTAAVSAPAPFTRERR